MALVETHAYVEVLEPVHGDHHCLHRNRLPMTECWPELPSRLRTAAGLSLGGVALSMKVAPLDQRVKIGHMWQA